MQKNVASQKVLIYAHDTISDVAKTGDAANITAYISKDGGATAEHTTPSANPTELDSTNMPGVYVFDLAQAETNCDDFVLYAKSSTSGVAIDVVKMVTTYEATLNAIKTITDALPDSVWTADNAKPRTRFGD